MICATCGHALEASARFCQQCGTAVAPPPTPPPPRAAAYPPPGAGYPPPSAGYPPPAPVVAPPAWGGSAGYVRPPERRGSTTGLRVASALLLLTAALFGVAGIFPEYLEGWSVTDDSQTLAMSLGFVAVLTFTAVFLLVARPRRWAAAGGAMALVVATAAIAIRVGEIASLASSDLTAGPGFYVQTVGDLFAASVWIPAIVIMVKSRSRIGADLRSLGPAAAGIVGLIAMVIGEASSRFTLSYGSIGGSGLDVTIPGAFDDFGWRNTTEVLMWFTVVLAVALGTFLFPRLAGGWGLLTGAVIVLVLHVLPPVLSTSQAKDVVSLGDDAMEIGLRAPFAWTVVAFVLLAVGGLIALVAPDEERGASR